MVEYKSPAEWILGGCMGVGILLAYLAKGAFGASANVMALLIGLFGFGGMIVVDILWRRRNSLSLTSGEASTIYGVPTWICGGAVSVLMLVATVISAIRDQG